MSGREERDPPTSGQFFKPLELAANVLQKELSQLGNRPLQHDIFPEHHLFSRLGRDAADAPRCSRGTRRMPQILPFCGVLRETPPGTRGQVEVGSTGSGSPPSPSSDTGVTLLLSLFLLIFEGSAAFGPVMKPQEPGEVTRGTPTLGFPISPALPL